MLARLAIVAGLVVGIAVAGVVLGGLVALTPDPPAPTIALPSIVAPSPSPSAQASVEPSSLPSASRSGSAPVGNAAFHIMAAGLKTILPGVDVTP